nr:hypothetical protein [Pseudophaeobacter leonis]
MITSSEGNNTLSGGGGDDTITGGLGDDAISGGAGNDVLAQGAGGSGSLDGGAGHDVLTGGDAAPQNLSGGSGNDTIGGGLLDDFIQGGAGSDVINGNGGADTIIGGSGRDILSGGSGADQFMFAPSDSGKGDFADAITDFNSFGDADLIALEMGTALDFIGAETFSGVGTGEVRVTEDGVDSTVLIDLDGDGTGDMAIIVEGYLGLVESDFLLT